MQILRRPYNLMLLTGLFLVLISFFVYNQKSTVDIHFHDTYFVVALKHVCWLFAFFVLFIWTLYVLANKMLYSKTLTWVHVVITIFTLALFVLTLYFGNDLLNAQARFYDPGKWNAFDTSRKFNEIIAIIIVIFFMEQMIFIINILAGLLKSRT